MIREPDEFDIARNIRELETLKTALLSGVTEVYQLMGQGGNARDALGEALASIMFCTVELANRVGVPTEDLDRRVTRRMKGRRLGTANM